MAIKRKEGLKDFLKNYHKNISMDNFIKKLQNECSRPEESIYFPIREIDHYTIENPTEHKYWFLMKILDLGKLLR